MVKTKDNLIGIRFGKLTVLKQEEDYVSPKGQHIAHWLCQCDCGNQVIVHGFNLRKQSGTKSCGCLQKEATIKKHKKQNIYNLSGEFGIGYDCNNKEFYFDLEDFNKIKNYCWNIDNNGYVFCSSKNIYMHRLIMNCAKGLMPDHINGVESRNDNRKCNLRIATYSQNNINKKIGKNNTSGVAGVSFNKRMNKWVAYISIDKKHIYLGSFISKDGAIQKRLDAEKEYFGEWSFNNNKTKEMI
jgi:hypothetical protein